MLLQLFLCNAPHVFQLLKKMLWFVFFQGPKGLVTFTRQMVNNPPNWERYYCLFNNFMSLMTCVYIGGYIDIRNFYPLISLAPKSAFQWPSTFQPQVEVAVKIPSWPNIFPPNQHGGSLLHSRDRKSQIVTTCKIWIVQNISEDVYTVALKYWPVRFLICINSFHLNIWISLHSKLFPLHIQTRAISFKGIDFP